MSAGVVNFVKGEDNVSNSPSIEIIGNKRVVIEQMKSILEYENDSVRVTAGGITVSVSGKKLTLNNYTDGVIVIDGIIKKISFD